MGIPANAVKITYNGHLSNGEIFSWGSWFDALTALTQAELDSLLSTATTAFASDLQAQQVIQLDTGSGYDGAKAYYYDGSGPHAALISEESLSVVGSSSGTDMPLQTCAVASLRTGRPGRSYRGRIYFPYLEGALTSHQFPSTFCSNFATDVANYLTAIKTASGGGFRAADPVVMSSMKSAMTPITQVLVDSKPDVQRRRAESEAILHVGSQVVPSP